MKQAVLVGEIEAKDYTVVSLLTSPNSIGDLNSQISAWLGWIRLG